MEREQCKVALSEIARLLEVGGEHSTAEMIRRALDANNQELEEFLASNELWGGAGSIADQSLIDDKARRKRLEQLLIRLGRLQITIAKANIRTPMWVEAFEKWHSHDSV